MGFLVNKVNKVLHASYYFEVIQVEVWILGKIMQFPFPLTSSHSWYHGQYCKASPSISG
jgi:hypothetical protein